MWLGPCNARAKSAGSLYRIQELVQPLEDSAADAAGRTGLPGEFLESVTDGHWHRGHP
jgi:hypothetical protein